MKKLFLILAAVLLSTAAMAQDSVRRVTGKVTDEDGQPMVGVGVVVTGTLNGVLSDDKGYYSIVVDSGNELQYSFL